MFKGLDNFTNYIFNMKDFANLDSIKNNFLKNTDNMKMFYCDFDYTKMQNINFKRTEKIINIPFDFIWIENPNFYVEGFEILGIGLKEENPEKQICYFSAKKENAKVNDIDGYILYCGSFSINTDYLAFGNVGETQYLYEHIANNVFEWLLFFESVIEKRININYLKNEEKLIKKGRINREFKKIKYFPSELIYICTDKTRMNQEIKRKIIKKPQYAFEVRGHWRKINTIGKDRNGKRTIEGYTWVIPYIKNKENENGLMKKIRIMKG